MPKIEIEIEREEYENQHPVIMGRWFFFHEGGVKYYAVHETNGSLNIGRILSKLQL